MLNLYNVSAIFLYFDYMFVFCLFTIINVLTKCISQHPWTSLKYRGYLYICYSWGVTWYIAQHVHIFCGCICDISRPIVTWMHLVYHIFLKIKVNSTHKWDMMTCLYTLYSFWGKPSFESFVWRSSYVCYIHDLVFIWQCHIFKTMDMTNIIEVATAALARTWVVRYFKKIIWIIYKNKWTCIFSKIKWPGIFDSAPLRNCLLPSWNTSRCMFDLTVVIGWKKHLYFSSWGVNISLQL